MLSQQLDIQQHAQLLGGQSAVTAAFAITRVVAASLAGWQVIAAAAATSQVHLLAHALGLWHTSILLPYCDRLKHSLLSLACLWLLLIQQHVRQHWPWQNILNRPAVPDDGVWQAMCFRVLLWRHCRVGISWFCRGTQRFVGQVLTLQ